MHNVRAFTFGFLLLSLSEFIFELQVCFFTFIAVITIISALRPVSLTLSHQQPVLDQSLHG